MGSEMCIRDRSDGLSSEIIHLAKASKKGFIIYEEKLPIDPEVIKISEEFKLNPLTSALNGGEDYELLFTSSAKNKENIKKIAEKNKLNLSIIGEVKNGNGEIMVDGSLTDPKGWDHFDN